MPELPSSDIHEYLPSSMLLMIPQGDYASGIDPSLKFNDFGQPTSESFEDETLTTGYQIESTQYLARAPKSKVQKETEKKLWNNLLSDIQKALKKAGGYLAEIADYVILDDVKQALKNLKDRNFKGLIWNGVSLSPWGKGGKKAKEAWEALTKEVANVTKKRRAKKAADDAKKATQGNQSGKVEGSKGSRTSIAYTYDPKIGKQMKKRGWTEELIQKTLDNPVRTEKTRDTRWLPGGKKKLDDPATAYYASDNSYVVRNDKTGDIVQISDKNNPDWKMNWDAKN